MFAHEKTVPLVVMTVLAAACTAPRSTVRATVAPPRRTAVPVRVRAPIPKGSVSHVFVPRAPTFTVHDLGSQIWVVSDDRMGRLVQRDWDWELRWDVESAGLPRTGELGPLEPEPFGSWPDHVFATATAGSEHGYAFRGVFAFDAKHKRWRALPMRGHFRAGISVYRTGATQWLAVRRGYGVGGGIPLELMALGSGSSPAVVLLPCRSEGSGILASESGEGHYYVVCTSIDGATTTLLHGSPERPRPEPFRDRAYEGVLVSPTRMVFIERGASDALVQVDLGPRPMAPPVRLASLPVAVERMFGERGGFLWFLTGSRGVLRRSPDGSLLSWTLPEGTRLAWTTPDGSAWIEGALIGRLTPAQASRAPQGKGAR